MFPVAFVMKKYPGLYMRLRTNRVVYSVYYFLKERLERIKKALRFVVSLMVGSGKPEIARPGASRSIFETRPSPLPLPRGKRTLYYYVAHTVTARRNTGIQRVVRSLARAWLENGERIAFVTWSADLRHLALCSRGDLARFADWDGAKPDPEAHPPGKNIPLQPADVRPGDWLVVPEVTHISPHADFSTLELRRCAGGMNLKTAFVYYDSIPLRHPQSAADAGVHENYLRALLPSDLVVPISRWSADELYSYFRFHEGAPDDSMPRIAPLPLPGERRRMEKGQENGEAFILSVGTLLPHKNHLTLMKAFAALHAAGETGGFELRLAGNIHSSLVEPVRAMAARCEKIKLLGPVPDETLEDLYRRCSFTVFPSVMEGCGLPILESLAHGKPCVCADFGAMAEVAELGGCLAVDTRDQDKLAGGMRRLILDQSLRDSLRAEAARSVLPTWRDYADGFSRLLDREADIIGKMGTVYCCVGMSGVRPDSSRAQTLIELAKAAPRAVPAIWDGGALRPADAGELAAAGLAGADWARWTGLSPERTPPWIFVPAFDAPPDPEAVSEIADYAKRNGALSALVLRENESPALMAAAAEMTKIFPVSSRAKIGCVNFLAHSRIPFHSIESRIETCVTPDPARPGGAEAHALEILARMAAERPPPAEPYRPAGGAADRDSFYREFVNLKPGPPQLDTWLENPWMPVPSDSWHPVWILEGEPGAMDLAERMGIDRDTADGWRRHAIERGFADAWRKMFDQVPFFAKLAEIGASGWGDLKRRVPDRDGSVIRFSPMRTLMRLRHMRELDKRIPDMRSAYSEARAEGHPAATLDENAVFAAWSGLPRPPRLFMDVSYIARMDSKSGIQRVVREIVRHCHAISDLEFQPVAVELCKGKMVPASRWLESIGVSPKIPPAERDKPAAFLPGDVLLMLDSSWNDFRDFFPVFAEAREAGTRVVSVVYDILPLTLGETWRDPMRKMFSSWLSDAAANVDGLLCISRSTMDEARRWIGERLPRREGLEFSYWHLGADFDRKNREKAEKTERLAKLDGREFLLMVGTVEPRKNHALAIEAMEILWRKNRGLDLAIAGKKGWMTEGVVKKMRHPGNGRLAFVESPSDGELVWLYKNARALLFASKGEGFGLPLIEAAQYGLPIVCSDIPVFHEIAGNFASYARIGSAAELAADLEAWHGELRAGTAPPSSGMPHLTWEESARRMVDALCGRSGRDGGGRF